MAKYEFSDRTELSEQNARALLAIANELAEQNDIARQMLEVHKEQVALLKKQSEDFSGIPSSGPEYHKWVCDNIPIKSRIRVNYTLSRGYTVTVGNTKELIATGYILTKPFLASGSAVTVFTVVNGDNDGKDNELGTVEIFNSDLKLMFDKGILTFIPEKVTTTSESFDTHIKNKRFRVKDYIVANIISTNQEVKPSSVLSSGSYNPSYGKVRFDVYDSSEVNAEYLGLTDIPIDMVLGYIRDGAIVVH